MASAEPRRGEVWLVSLGAGREGEPAKHSPAVVVSADQLNVSAGPSELIVVVPLSSSRAPSSLRPIVPASAGLDRDSRAICRATRGVSRGRLLDRLGSVPPQTFAEIEQALALTLGIGGRGQEGTTT
jgi:mRNA interferase MazF